MNETQALQEELNRLHAAFTVHKQETERTITNVGNTDCLPVGGEIFGRM